MIQLWLVIYPMMASDSLPPNGSITLKVVCYNMHGFHQGYPVLEDLTKMNCPDIVLLQEHWLTPDNICKFDRYFPNYFSFGRSAMLNSVQAGMLRGRPFGGVITLVNNNLRNYTESVKCDDRYAIIKVGDLLLVNIYLPCSGTNDRLAICEDIFLEIGACCERFPGCQVIVAGDFNCNLDNNDVIAQSVNSFMAEWSLVRCDQIYPNSGLFTYVNPALDHYSYIDFILVSKSERVTNFEILDPDINFSDHLPLFVSLECFVNKLDRASGVTLAAPKQLFPRWDRADLGGYYKYTGDHLAPFIAKIDELILNDDHTSSCIDELYVSIVSILINGERLFVPRHSKTFTNFGGMKN